MKSIEDDNFVLQLPPSYDNLPIKKDVKKPSDEKKNISKQSDEVKKEKRRRRRKADQTHPSDIASPKRRTVSFAPVIRFKPVKHIDDFTEEQIEATWYTEYDLNIIRAACITTVRQMVFKKTINEETDCTRGLEFKTPSGAKFRKNNKQTAIEAVLAEQRLQKSMGMVDEEYLSEVYSEAAGNSKRIAHLMALRDEQHEDKPTKEKKSTDFVPTKAPRSAKSLKAGVAWSNPLSPIAACPVAAPSLHVAAFPMGVTKLKDIALS